MPPARFPHSSDLDGWYAWIGPSGAASRLAGQWDSAIGGQLAVVHVHEHDSAGAVGGALGASLWTERGGGRLWADALLGTRLAGHMFGVSAGPILELAPTMHPRAGATFGVWAFAGVTPFVRVGAVDQLGGFVEIGIHLALPAIRW